MGIERTSEADLGIENIREVVFISEEPGKIEALESLELLGRFLSMQRPYPARRSGASLGFSGTLLEITHGYRSRLNLFVHELPDSFQRAQKRHAVTAETGNPPSCPTRNTLRSSLRIVQPEL